MSQHDRQQQESLSALMDNEADDLELRRLLKACEQDPSLLQTWERYHLVQARLHGPATVVSPYLSKRIATQLQSEATLSKPLHQTNASRMSPWQQTLSKFAIAASVAAVFIVAMQTSLQPDAVPAIAQQQPLGATPVVLESTPANLVAGESAGVTLDPIAQRRLQEYIERMAFDDKEPLRTEHIQDSPLFRLVNELGTVDPQ